MANCPMCGELWNDETCTVCGWKEGKQPRYTSPRRDKRKTGEGAIRGWATRRRTQQDRRAALDRLIEVADSITSDLVVGERATDPGKYVVGALTLINWRDRISSALRILDGKDATRHRLESNDVAALLSRIDRRYRGNE